MLADMQLAVSGLRRCLADGMSMCCRYDDPSTKGKLVFYDSSGKTLPTGQSWCEKCESLGGGRFRMEFDWGNRYVMRIPGVPKVGNFITQGSGPEAIAISCDTNVTIQDCRQVPLNVWCALMPFGL